MAYLVPTPTVEMFESGEAFYRKMRKYAAEHGCVFPSDDHFADFVINEVSTMLSRRQFAQELDQVSKGNLTWNTAKTAVRTLTARRYGRTSGRELTAHSNG